MISYPLLIIANPTARNGEGMQAGMFAKDALGAALGHENVNLQFTQSKTHAVDLAHKVKSKYKTVLAIGGDGVIHEVANGLMKREIDDRPNFAIMPVGSGNDFARSVKMSTNQKKSISQILQFKTKKIDVGKVNNEFFVETLSFGLDAAIAIETMESRKEHEKTKKSLYFKAGVDQILHHMVEHDFKFEAQGLVSYDEKHPIKFADNQAVVGKSITFAIQVGPTYGGGFKICPKAQIDDGYFDVCYRRPPINLAGALSIFTLAKSGRHVNNKSFEFFKFQKMQLDFEQEPATQADGEKLNGKHFEIELLPHQLNAIVG
ncbi:MAG: diacylglycerol kinase family lipid kinase [Coriobacteriales bacterium]|nr:diacylglycerol kinase family lipid kinase [Coriobacteriales bacterium]